MKVINMLLILSIGFMIGSIWGSFIEKTKVKCEKIPKECDRVELIRYVNYGSLVIGSEYEI